MQSIVAAGNSVVATVAGDTHNYQRMVVHGLTDVTPEGVAVRAGSSIPEDTPYPSVQIVAGGAGAYMSRTHNVRHDGANLLLNRPGDAEDIVVPGGAHRLFPGRAESVLGYARRLRDGYLLTLEALSIVGLLAMAWLVQELVTSYDAVADVSVEPLWVGEEATLSWFTAWTWVTLLVVAALAGIGWAAARAGGKQPVNTRTLLRWLGVLALLIVVAVVAFTLDWGLAEAVLIVLGLAEVLVLALAHYLVPLLQSFPRLRRSWGFRLVVAAAVLPIILSNRESAVGLILVGVAVAAAVVAVRSLFRKWRHWAERRMHGPSLVALGVIPFADGRAGDLRRDVVLPRPDPGCGVRPGRVDRGRRRTGRADELAGDPRARLSRGPGRGVRGAAAAGHAAICRRSCTRWAPSSAWPWPWSCCGGDWATA